MGAILFTVIGLTQLVISFQICMVIWREQVVRRRIQALLVFASQIAINMLFVYYWTLHDFSDGSSLDTSYRDSFFMFLISIESLSFLASRIYLYDKYNEEYEQLTFDLIAESGVLSENSAAPQTSKILSKSLLRASIALRMFSYFCLALNSIGAWVMLIGSVLSDLTLTIFIYRLSRKVPNESRASITAIVRAQVGLMMITPVVVVAAVFLEAWEAMYLYMLYRLALVATMGQSPLAVPEFICCTSAQSRKESISSSKKLVQITNVRIDGKGQQQGFSIALEDEKE